MECRQAELFKILGVNSRIKIIKLLKQNGPMCVNEISDILGITPSAVSQHLKILKYAGLVTNERKGYWIPYAVDPAALECCHEFLSSVCTCGCNMRKDKPKVNYDTKKDKLNLLERYKNDLQNELKDIQERINELKKKL